MNARVIKPSYVPPAARIAAAKKKLVEAIDELVEARLATAATQSDWVSQVDSPLGSDRHLKLCRRGILKAVVDGNRRLVRRGDIDAYLLKHPMKPSGSKSAAANDSPDDECVDDIVNKIRERAQ